MKVIWVLFFKHLIVRKRRYFNTFFELAVPILLLVLLNSLKPLLLIVAPESAYQQYHYEEIVPAEIPLQNVDELTREGFQHLLYYPETTETTEFMEKAAHNLGALGSPRLGVQTIEIEGFNQESEAYTEMQKYKKTKQAALILFQNFVNSTKHLKYTMRLFENFDIESIGSGKSVNDYHGILYERFMALQWAMNKAFIQQHGVDANLEVTMQELPMRSTHKHSREDEIYMLACAIYLATTFALIMYFVNLVSRLTMERASGVKELLKMNGVDATTLRLSHMLDCLPTSLIFVIGASLVLKLHPGFLPCTATVEVVVTLLLVWTYLTCLAFVCASLLQSPGHTTAVSLTVYLGLMTLATLLASDERTNSFSIIGIVFNVPALWFWLEAASLYELGVCASGNIFHRHSSFGRPVALCWCLMVLHALVLAALAWYLDHVRPGKYGLAKPWDFVFKRRFWATEVCGKVEPEVTSDSQTEPLTSDNQQYFEKRPVNKEVGIKCDGVTKIYGSWFGPKVRSLSNVSCDIYKGEITVLLGHNGAGKTTLMSIITGMFGATEGKLYVNGLDTSRHMEKIRKGLGLCPQHNITFPDLTVRQHVVFFAMLKGLCYAEANKRATALLDQLTLKDKAHYCSEALSGGMKRRLQLACALAAPHQTLVLDEPTSGLDLNTRRELWDLLLSMRGERTVLVSTHFMEEAEALGDRVLVLQAGRVQAYATPHHLKKATGGGYRLSLTLEENYSESNVTQVIKTLVPEAKVQEQTRTTLTYALPATNTQLLAEVFDQLEKKKKDLGVVYMAVGLTTLEEVFLKLCSESETHSSDAVDNSELLSSIEHRAPKVTGVTLSMQRFRALLCRHFRFLYTRKWNYLLFYIIMPIAMIMYVTYDTGGSPEEVDTHRRTMDLRIYAPVYGRKFLYNVPNVTQMDAIIRKYEDVEFLASKNPIYDILQVQTRQEYFKYIGGMDINGSSAKVLYTTGWLHAGPVCLGVVSNYLSGMAGADIETDNWPMTKDVIRIKVTPVKSDGNILTYAIIMCFAVVFPLLPLIKINIRERKSGSRHIHIMAGVNPVTHWCASLCTGVAIHALFVPTSMLASILIFENDHTFNRIEFLVALVIWVILYGIVYLAFLYVLSLFMNEAGYVTCASIVTLFTGFIISGIVLATSAKDLPSLLQFLYYLSLCLPMANFSKGLYNIGKTVKSHADCELNKVQICSAPVENERGFCCQNVTTTQYIIRTIESSTLEMSLLVFYFILYMAIVLLVENGTANRFWDRIVNRKYRRPKSKHHDAFVEAEKEYVDKTYSRGTKDPSCMQDGADSMLVDGVHKMYRTPFRPSCNAVRGVSFSVKCGECFGLLGVNGAGKSSVFKMLTGIESVTAGDVHGIGYSLRARRSKYLSGLGYCPQFGGIDEFLSARDNLELSLSLQGYGRDEARKLADLWIRLFGLSGVSERPTGRCSGGEARRASAACAMAGRAFSLLDEPTAGVDPGARRLVWRALQHAKASACSIVITSHSLDEMEALCGRIALLCGGEVRALGCAAELRVRHADARAATITLAPARHDARAHDAVDGADVEMSTRDAQRKEKVDLLKKKVHDTFTASLKDEHLTMLQFTLAGSLPCSEIFRSMERIKNEFPDLVEDYVIRDTTLEEVFLSFAREEDRDIEV